MDGDNTHASPRPLPAYDELPALPGLGMRHAWDVYGRDDQLGTVNLLGPDGVRNAAHEVRDGTVINLVVPLNAIDPPLYGREPLEHTIFQPDRNGLDDRLDTFYPQASSQWDGLRHVRAREHGFWGGRTDAAEFGAATGPLGIEHWVEHGMVGRGVLIDLEQHLRRAGDYDPFAERSIDGADIERAAAAQGTEIRRGDVLCLRFGWMGAYRARRRAGEPTDAAAREFAGLAADENVARWLWNRGVAAVACDNPTVEVAPGDPAVGFLHRRLLPLLGFALGELFDFDELATLCRSDNRWDFLFVSVPLYIPGGVGSPANAIAIR